MPDSLYDPARYDTLHPVYTREQCRRGGLKSVQGCKRDDYGRFAPRDNTVSISLPVDHGRAGGLARIGKAVRDKKGRFVK